MNGILKRLAFIFAVNFFLCAPSYAYILQNICQQKKCPVIESNTGNTLTITCQGNDCSTSYQNSDGLKGKYSKQFFISSDAKITWISNNAVEIKTFLDAGMWSSLFIDFKNMKTAKIDNVYAVNPDKLVAVYDDYNLNPPELAVSSFFNKEKKIIISEKFSGPSLSLSVVIPDTHFNKNGDLVLVYDKGSKSIQTTKIVPIDYKKLGVD